MPKIVRSMREDNGKPAIGPRDLGVRLPPDASADITLDAIGDVHPDQGGMSVSPSASDLLPHLIPRRLTDRFPDATGANSRRIWRWGDGPFETGMVAPRLQLRVDPARSTHGFIEPNATMPVNDYSEAIEATREQWRIDEGY